MDSIATDEQKYIFTINLFGISEYFTTAMTNAEF